MKLAVYSSECRAKETAIHKFRGASVGNVTIFPNKDFIKLVAVAFKAASPLGWYVMTKWLQDFAYSTDVSWWIFAHSGVIVLTIALIPASRQKWRTTTANRLEALRYE